MATASPSQTTPAVTCSMSSGKPVYLYKDYPDAFARLRSRAMESDFSWKRSAGEYLHIYSNITGQPWPPASEEPVPAPEKAEEAAPAEEPAPAEVSAPAKSEEKALRVDTTGRALVAKEEKPTALTEIPADQPKALVSRRLRPLPPRRKSRRRKRLPRPRPLRRRRLRRRRSLPGSPQPKRRPDARRQRSPQRPNLHQPRRPTHRLHRKRRPRRMGPQLLMRRSKRSKEGS